jgi:DNA-binding transcriptional LysR family regulator
MQTHPGTSAPANQIPRISLEQWLAFKTVVDTGSYASAAERLNKSQSAISYAIQRLNEQLPGPVLSLRGRKAELTELGTVLYRHAEQLLKQASHAETVARSMAAGLESEVVLAIDSLLAIDEVVCVFEEFSQRFPNTRLRVLETTLSGTTEALLERQADIVVTATTPPGLVGPILRKIEMIFVASPKHPLVSDRDDVSELELQGHRQVVLRDSGARREVDSGWLRAEQRWTVSHFSSSIKIVKTGLAFAIVPRNWVEAEIAAGELCEIPMQRSLARSVPLYVLLSDRDAAGPATRSLFTALTEELRR